MSLNNTIVVTISKEFEIVSISDTNSLIYRHKEKYLAQSKCIKKLCRPNDPHCQELCKNNSNRIVLKGHSYEIVSKTLYSSNGQFAGYIDFIEEQLQTDNPTETTPINENNSFESFKYETLFQSLNVAYAIIKKNVNSDFSLVKCNPQFEKLTGFKEEELFGKSVHKAMAKDEQFWTNIFTEAEKEKDGIETLFFSDEKKKNFHIKAFSPLENYFAISFYDITNKIKAEKELKERNDMYIVLNQELEESLERIGNINEKLLKTKQEAQENEEILFSIFNNAPISMLLFNEKGDIVQINKAGSQISGKEVSINNKSEIKEGNVLNCIEAVTNFAGCGSGIECKRCKIREAIGTTLQTGKNIHKIEADVKTNSEPGKYSIKTYLISTSKILKNGKQHVLVSLDDITDRKKIENDLIHAKLKAEESDRLKSSFLANMSHEIRTPLNGIVGFSNLMARNPDITYEQRKKYSKYISNGTESLINIINDIIEISRIESGILEIINSKFDLNEVLIALEKRFTKEIEFSRKNISLKLHKCEKPLYLFSDENRIIQIFESLLNNALKFTQEGKIEFGIERRNDYSVVLFVSDTGIGIAKEQHNIIFERFRQVDEAISRKYGGNGLGLAIVNEILKLLNGTISVDSEIGKGSTFLVELPLSIEDQNESSTTVTEENNNTLNILVVEDDEINLIYLLEVLEDQNLNIEIARDGSQAVEMAQDKFFDVILMDIQMPVMNGFEAVKKIREFNKNVFIIAQTAYAMTGDAEKVKELGCDDYISKPIDIELLHEKIWNRKTDTA